MLLHFRTKDLLPLIAHARSAEAHSTLYGRECGPSLFLVKDEGVYLMSNGQPRESGEHVVYAKGFEPGRTYLSGDDFAEAFAADEVAQWVQGKDFLEFVLTEDQLEISTY